MYFKVSQFFLSYANDKLWRCLSIHFLIIIGDPYARGHNVWNII